MIIIGFILIAILSNKEKLRCNFHCHHNDYHKFDLLYYHHWITFYLLLQLIKFECNSAHACDTFDRIWNFFERKFNELNYQIEIREHCSESDCINAFHSIFDLLLGYSLIILSEKIGISLYIVDQFGVKSVKYNEQYSQSSRNRWSSIWVSSQWIEESSSYEIAVSAFAQNLFSIEKRLSLCPYQRHFVHFILFLCQMKTFCSFYFWIYLKLVILLYHLSSFFIYMQWAMILFLHC